MSLKWAGDPACTGALVCVTGPDGATWRYVGTTDGGTAGDLQSVSDGTRTLLQIGYDGSDRPNAILNADDLDPGDASPGYASNHSVAISYLDGRVYRIADTNVHSTVGSALQTRTTEFDYYAGACTGSTLQDPQQTHGFSRSTLAYGCTAVTSPSQFGQPTAHPARAFYDVMGHPLEIDSPLQTSSTNKNYVLYAYDTFNTLEWWEDGDGSATDNSYDPDTHALTQTQAPDPQMTGLGRPTTSYRYDETVAGTASTAGAALTGLQGRYYSVSDFSLPPSGVATDPTVDSETWSGGQPPFLGAQKNDISIRWAGEIDVPSGGYYLATVADGGSRVTLDGTALLIDQWSGGQTSTTPVCTPSNAITQGHHQIVVEYNEGSTGTPSIKLEWGTSCTSAALSVVPTATLAPEWLNQTSAVTPAVAAGGQAIVAFRHYPAVPTGGASAASHTPDYSLQTVGSSKLLTSYQYDVFGRPTGKVLPNGNGSATIDGSGNLSGAGNPGTSNWGTTYAYYDLTETATTPSPIAGVDCEPSSVKAQLALSKTEKQHGLTVVATVYDAAGRPVSVTKGAGTVYSCYDHNGEGRLTGTIAPGESQPTLYTYDPAGNELSASHAGTSDDTRGSVTHVYNEAGESLSTTDANGAEETYGYDRDGDVVSRAATPISGGSTYTTNYAYDAADRLTSETDPGGQTYSFGYDDRGNLRSTQYPNGTYSFDQVNPDGWLTASCDHHGTVPASPPAVGCPTDDANPISDSTYSYSEAGKKLSQTDTIATASHNLGNTAVGGSTVANNGADVLDVAGPYTLSAAGTVSKLTGYLAASSSGSAKVRAVIYSDNSGQPGAFKAVSDEVTLPAGQAAGWFDFTIPAGVTLPAGSYWVGYWYGDDNTIRYYTPDAGAESYVAVDYSSSGNPPATFVREGTNNQRLSLYAVVGSAGATTSYVYDQGGRLAQVALPSGVCRSYSYDLDGNRTQVQESTTGCAGSFQTTANYTYTSGANIGVDELTGQTGPTRSFSYDSDGNMTGRGSDSFSWDGLGRLQSSTAGGTTVSYRYDPEGGLETRTSSSPSSTTNYLLGGSYETDGSRAITESYIDGPAGNLAQYDGPPPPTSSSATLGTTTIGASTVGNNGAGVLDLAGPYTLSGSLTVSKLRGYLAASSSGNAKLRAVIYSDNSGQPGTLKAVSDEVTLTAGEAAAWVDLALPANVTLSAGSYWVGYWYGDNNAIRYYDAVAGAESYAHVDYSSSGDPPGTYIEEGTNDEKLSLYATGSSGSSSVHYLYYNGHGDLAAETSASGSRTAAYTYDPFGALLEPPAANSTSHRYTAEWDKQYDSSSNLVLMGARPYDPDLGRFLAIDPVDGGSLNSYDYAGQDPVNGYDLDGTMLQAIADRPCMTTCGATIDGFGMASPGKIAGRLGSAAEGAPIILAIAAGVACTASTEGACGPLAWSALSSSVLKSAHDDGVLGGGRAHKGRFVADVAIASSFYGLGKALEAASSPYFIQTKGDQRQFRGIGNAILFVLDLLQHAAR